MIDYVASFTNTDAVAFPDTGSVNASGPSATDGTEFVKLMIDDIWGAKQAMLNYAGLIPDGVTEADGTSQIVEALQLGFGGSPGFVQEWNLDSDPGTTGHRCLFLQGQGILRANYAALDDAVYVGDGDNAAVAAGGGFYYRADNANGTSPSTTGIYLILPERRGVAPRGLDVAASIDPDGASRFLGDLQIDAGQGHIHFNGVADDATVAFVYGSTTDDIPGSSSVGLSTGGTPSDQGLASTPKTDGASGTPRTDSETRMYNASTHFVIWY
jgi:hypothetical protein